MEYNLFDLIILVWKVLKFLQVEGTTFAFVSKRLWVLVGHLDVYLINKVPKAKDKLCD